MGSPWWPIGWVFLLVLAGCASGPRTLSDSGTWKLSANGAQQAAPPTVASTPCMSTYDCCVARHPATPEVCGVPPRTQPLGPTLTLPTPSTAVDADAASAADAETKELCGSYLTKCNKSWISRVPGSVEGESQCATCYWKCRGLGFWPVRTDDGKACLPF